MNIRDNEDDLDGKKGKDMKTFFRAKPVLAVLSILVIAAIAIIAVSANTVLATPGSDNFTRTLLGRTTLEPLNVHSPDVKVQLKNETDMIMVRFEIGEDGYTGWHSHPGPVLLTVAQGQFKIIRYTKKGGCTEEIYGPGEGFIGAPNVVHYGSPVNGSVMGHVTFLNVPVGESPLDASHENPGCSTD